MREQRRRPEPVAKLSDYLSVVATCSRCKSEIRMLFSQLVQRQSLGCEACGLSWGFDLDRDVLGTLDQAFRRLEDPIRDREAWVEVQPYDGTMKR